MRTLLFFARAVCILSVVLALSAVRALPVSADPPGRKSAGAWIPKGRYGDIAIVTGESPSETEAFAASEFQRIWERSTGHRPELAEVSISGRVNILLGRSGNPRLSKEEVLGLGVDGLLIRTQDFTTWTRRSSIRRSFREALPIESKRLVVTGNADRGTLYAVYEFMREYMGVRWFAPDLVRIPPPPEFLPEIDHRYVPPFTYRDVSARVFVESPRFAAIHGVNGMWSAVPDEMGGHMGYAGGKPYFGHTFHHFVSPAQYFDEHPEYFSKVGGVRVRDSQLCLTNPDVLAITVEKALVMLREAGANDRIISVTQMDRGLWCACENCRAVDKAEGSQSGSIIHFVNRVAEAIEGEFPDAYVDTFAYVYSRKPPKRVKPRDNVIVRLCAIEADYSTPLSNPSSERNSAFAKDVWGWAKITKNLYVWDYTLNWHSHLGPHPNVPVLQPNAKFFADAGVSGVYEQASPVSPHTDFEHLKGYILARSLWNPTVDWRELWAEFVSAYYGPAAPFISEYLELLEERVGGDDVILTMANSMQWMDYDTVVKALDIFRRAAEATPSKPFRARLLRARLPVYYAALVCPPKVTVRDSSYLLVRPPTRSFDQFWEMLKRYGITHYNDYPIEVFWEALGGETPPRRQRIRFEMLESDRYTAWMIPSMGGMLARINDKQAGVEIVPSHEDILRRPRKPRAWNQANYAAGTAPEQPGQYMVVERSNATLALETVHLNGLIERRVFSLVSESGAMRVSMEYTNESDTALSIPSISLTPHAVAESAPRRVWVRDGKRWRRTKLQEDEVWIPLRDEGERGWIEWAIRTRDGAYIINRATTTGIQGLHLTYYRVQGDFFGEVWPALAPLHPGESRTVVVEMCAEPQLP